MTAGLHPGRFSTGLDARLLLPAMVAWAAVVLALSRPPWLVAAVAVPVTLAGLGALHRRWRHRAWAMSLALIGLATGLCLLATAGQASVREAGLVPSLAQQRAVATIEAVVRTDPRVITTKGARSTQLVMVRLDVRTITARGQSSGAATPVMAFADLSWSSVRWHERIRTTGRFDLAEPGDDVVAIFKPSRAPERLAAPGLVADAAEHVRAGLRAATAGLPADARGLLPGLIIGDRSQSPPSLSEAMQQTGLTHLDAVSGSNVAVVLAAAMVVCRACGLRRRWRPLVAGAVLAGFVVLARPEPSVLRAAVMGSIGLLGLSASRRRAGVPALSGAVVVLLCIDPWLSRSFGFALSTLATLGLLLFVRPWGRWFARFLPRRIRGLGEAIAIPVAAQAMCGPVVVILQGSVTVIGVVANLLAAPLVAPATVLGVLVALVALVSHPVATVLAWAAGVPTLGVAWIARFCADVPMGSIPWPDGAVGAFLLAGLSLVLLFGGPWLIFLCRRRPLVVASLGVVTLAATWPTRGVAWPPPQWRIVACDVGQGDGLVLATTPGHAVVVDAGPDPAPMDACLRRLGITVVDAVVLSHFHADHAEGLPGVLHGRVVRQVLTTPVRDPPYQAREVLQWAAAARVPVADLYAGDELRWGQVSAHVVWPARVIQEGSIPNNSSVVLVVNAAGLSILMLGDVETPAAHEVLLELRREQDAVPTAREGAGAAYGAGPAPGAGPAYGLDLAREAAGGFDVIKVAHHGSRFQDPGLIVLAHADVALISVGAENTYGHPARTTLDLLRAEGTAILRTDQSGDISVSRGSDGSALVATRGR